MVTLSPLTVPVVDIGPYSYSPPAAVCDALMPSPNIATKFVEFPIPVPATEEAGTRFGPCGPVGPVDPVREEVVGPAGPTTSTRMDRFTRQMLEQTGLLGMVGKAERGPAAIEAIRDHKAVYLMAVGGAAYLVSKAIRGSRVLAFEDLGMEAIYEFDVKDMPVTVAVDSEGNSVHHTGPKEWQARIAGVPILQ